MKKGPFLLLGLVALAALAAGFQVWTSARSNQAHYLYWCKDCKAVFDVSELKRDPKGWRVVPGLGDGSVVICPRCGKGWAYPAVKCPKCGTYHILHLGHNSECPNCNPQVAKEAADLGLNLTPPELR